MPVAPTTQSPGWSRRIGRQAPTYRVCPSYERTLGPECVEFARLGGLELLPWQSSLLDDWLALRPDGLWANPTPGLSVPRQNGKTEGPVLARVAYGLVVLGERVIFTSHRQDAATEFYDALTGFLGSGRYRKFIDPEVFRSALGREKVPTRRGNAVTFIARGNKGGRAKHSDLIIADEAQFLTDTQLASLSPTQNTALNPQTIFLGTPPELPSDGEVFRRVRKSAHDGEPDACWAEWGVADLPEDPGDRELWYECNPSLGLLIPETNLVTLFRVMDSVGFAREVLGWWAPEVSVSEDPPAIEPETWKRAKWSDPPDLDGTERIGCGVKFSPDGLWYSVSMCALAQGRPAVVECVDRAPASYGIDGLVEWLDERRPRIALLAIDGREWADTLRQSLREHKWPKGAVRVMTANEYVSACAMAHGALRQAELCHTGQPLLDDSARSPKRKIGRDGWGFDGPESTPIESAAMAYWAARTTKRNPTRKGRVSV